MQCPPFTKASESSIVLNYDFSNIIITLKTRSILEQAREQMYDFDIEYRFTFKMRQKKSKMRLVAAESLEYIIYVS